MQLVIFNLRVNNIYNYALQYFPLTSKQRYVITEHIPELTITHKRVAIISEKDCDSTIW